MHSTIKYIYFIGLLLLLIGKCYGLSQSTVSEVPEVLEIFKRETNSPHHYSSKTTKLDSNFYPDWGSIDKNIGDHIQINKPKKRLAPPINYILKVVENDDIYDKPESDGDEDFERKEWTDLFRGASDAQTEKQSDFEKKLAARVFTDDAISEASVSDEAEEENSSPSSNSTTDSNDNQNGKPSTVQEDVDYDDSLSESKKIKEEEERAKKEKILKEVDELKEKHAQEQQMISKKSKNGFLLDHRNEYKKYEEKGNKNHDYDTYDETPLKVHDKYPIHTSPRITTSTEPTKTSRAIIHNRSQNDSAPRKIMKYERKRTYYNPTPYVDNEIDSPANIPVETTTFITTESFPVVKGNLAPNLDNIDESVRISLVPAGDDARDNEPTSFFIKKRKIKRKGSTKTDIPVATTFAPSSDASFAETMNDKLVTAADPLPTVTDTEYTSSDALKVTATDALPSSSEVKEKESGDKKFEKGSGKEDHTEHHSENEEHGKKGYKAIRNYSKSTKGHHDKQSHHGEYDDKGGHDKYHHKEDGVYGTHHQKEKGKKHAKYEESGKHSKGHSTKGSHNVHKKDEYEKNVEFFEEDGDSGGQEKQGEFSNHKEHALGNKHHTSGKHQNFDHHTKGDNGHHNKGAFHTGLKETNDISNQSESMIVEDASTVNNKTDGFQLGGGHAVHGSGGQVKHNHGFKEADKNWIYHQGYPAKTANLVVIDRRMDKLTNGPLKFG